jgi:hypothetical protein
MDVVRYCLSALAAGSVAGLLGAWALIWSDVGSLRELMAQSSDGWLATALLAFGFGLTFGSVAVGGAIIAIGRNKK